MSRERSANHNGINKGVGIVKRAFRVLSMTVVVGLLAAAFGVAGVFAQAVEVDENEVEWQAGDFVSPGDDGEMVTFHIRDDIALPLTGKATWQSLQVDVELGDELDLTDGSIGGVLASATSTRYTREPDTFDKDANPINSAKVGSSGIATPSGRPGRVITLVPGAAGSEYVVNFTYDVADVFSGDKNRARVTSNSDPQGEDVTIEETGPTTELYMGSVMISGDGATRGADDDGVYVQDGDTLTVTYLDKDGSAVDSDDITVDAQAPTVSGISPDDGLRTNNERQGVSFTVTDTGSGISIENLTDSITLMINGEPADLRGSFLAAADGYEVRFSQTTKWTESKGADGGFGVRDGEEFLIEIMATDDAGNTNEVAARKMTVDITAPSVTDVKTGDAATNIRVSFTEDLDEDSIDADDFWIDGLAAEAAKLVELGEGDDQTRSTVDLTVAALDSDASPNVTIPKGMINDVAGNANAKDERNANDGIAPGLSSVVVDTPLAKEKDKVKTTLSSGEKLATGGVIVSINGPADDDTISGMKAASSTQPLEYAATVTVAKGTETGRYGVSIQITDVAQNSSDNLTPVKNEEVTVEDGMVTVAKTPIGDRNFDGDVDADDVTVPDGMTAGAVDASAGTIAISGADEGDEIAVTYKYVADATFEVDHDAPTISFTPASETSIENTSPYIRVTFNDTEYPGDSHTATWLTSAMLTGPDGEETDVMDEFQTGDNKNYLWAASDLALGRTRSRSRARTTTATRPRRPWSSR